MKNNENKLYCSIVKLSLCNNLPTLGENICHFMYKYKIYDYECYESINVILKTLGSYVLSRLDEDVQCDAIAIRKLCELTMTMTMTMKISLFDINHLNTMIRERKTEKIMWLMNRRPCKTI